MADAFKKGDPVRCVDASECAGISTGDTYFVERHRDDCVELVGHDGRLGLYGSWRFVLADSAPTPEEHPAVTKAKEIATAEWKSLAENGVSESVHRGMKAAAAEILLAAGYVCRTVTKHEWVPATEQPAPCSR